MRLYDVLLRLLWSLCYSFASLTTNHSTEHNESTILLMGKFERLPNSSYIRLCKIYYKRNKTTFRAAFLMRNFHMDTAPPYRALSYTWGPAEGPSLAKTQEVIFVSNNPNLVLSLILPGNLMVAIDYFQEFQVNQWYWIDALCINQTDYKERAEQVANMDRIYQEAQVVDIWLGRSNVDTPRLIDMLHELSQEESIYGSAWNQDLCEQGDSYNYRYSPRFCEAGEVFFRSDDQRILTDFVSRRWFSRLWTIQEVALATRAQVIIGNHTIDLKVLEHAMFHVYDLSLAQGPGNSHAKALGLPVVKLAHWRQAVKNPKILKSILPRETQGGNQALFAIWPDYESIVTWVFWQSTAALATDHRDYVYGLIGITNALASSIAHAVRCCAWRIGTSEVDYQLSVAQVYQNFVMELMKGQPGLQAITLVHPSSVDATFSPDYLDNRQLPSWVPNLSSRGHPPLSNNGQLLPHAGVRGMRVTGNYSSKHNQPVSVVSNRLHLYGRRIGVIKQVSKPIPTDGNLTEGMEFILSLIDILCYLPWDYYLTHEKPFQVLLRTMALDHYRDLNAAIEMEPSASDIRNMLVQAFKLRVLSETRMWHISVDIVLSDPSVSIGLHRLQGIVGMPEAFLAKHIMEWRSAQTFFEWSSSTDCSAYRTIEWIEFALAGLTGSFKDAGGQKIAILELDGSHHVPSSDDGNRSKKPDRTRLMAMGSDLIEGGDEIWAFDGSDWPFVLRSKYCDQSRILQPIDRPYFDKKQAQYERDEQVDIHRYLGEAYVHGIMRGELYEGRPAHRGTEVILE